MVMMGKESKLTIGNRFGFRGKGKGEKKKSCLAACLEKLTMQLLRMTEWEIDEALRFEGKLGDSLGWQH